MNGPYGEVNRIAGSSAGEPRDIPDPTDVLHALEALERETARDMIRASRQPLEASAALALVAPIDGIGDERRAATWRDVRLAAEREPIVYALARLATRGDLTREQALTEMVVRLSDELGRTRAELGRMLAERMPITSQAG